MIVEPTPTNPRSPVRRALRLAGLTLPVVLFAGVLGAGLLGPKPQPITPVPTAIPVASPAAAVSAPPVVAVGVEEPVAPTQFGDLRSTTPGELLATRGEAPTSAALAVTGFLRIDGSADGGCVGDAGGPLGPWCERQGMLADRSWIAPNTLTGPVPPHLDLSIPVGVRLPDPVERSAAGPGGGGVRVLAVGRFGPATSTCRAVDQDCREVFVVERFAWADGVRVGLTPLIADRLDTGTMRPNPFATILDAADLPLEAVLVWPDAVAALDPAAGALAAAGPPSEPVWYVRVLDGARGPGMERNVRWMLLAERDLRVLGSGRLAGTTATRADATFPVAVANLRVTQVPAVLQARREGRSQGVVAVAGYLRAWADPQRCRNPVPGLPGVGCERTAILAEVSWSNPGSEVFSGMGPHLHGVIPPGVAIPDTAVGLAPANGDPPPPVVVIGHFAPGAAACLGDDPGCEETFIIERVIWASGQRLTLGRQVASTLVVSGDDPMAAEPEVAASRAVGPVTTLLRMVLVPSEALATVDPAAGAAVARGTSGSGPIWYLRGLDVPYDPLLDPPYGRLSPVIRWAVVDLHGKVIASREVPARAQPVGIAKPTG